GPLGGAPPLSGERPRDHPAGLRDPAPAEPPPPPAGDPRRPPAGDAPLRTGRRAAGQDPLHARRPRPAAPGPDPADPPGHRGAGRGRVIARWIVRPTARSSRPSWDRGRAPGRGPPRTPGGPGAGAGGPSTGRARP